MDTVLIKTITRAHMAGLELDVVDGELLVLGTPPPELLARRDDVRVLLLAKQCAACAGELWIREDGTAIPWCRPCARRRGEQLLRHEHPHLVTDHQEVA